MGSGVVESSVIDDDAETVAYLRKGLEQHRHSVDWSVGGRDGLILAGRNVTM